MCSVLKRSLLSFFFGSIAPLALAQIQFASAIKYDISVPDAGQPPGLAIADFDHDGRPDIVVAFRSSMQVILNKGDGTFRSPISYTGGGGAGTVAAADFNGDGYPDLVTIGDYGSVYGSYVRTYLNRKDGTFGSPTDYSLLDGFVRSVVVGDFDGDGRPDIAALSGSWSVTILRNKGDGTFEQVNRFPAPTFNGNAFMYAADLNGDGLTDLYFTWDGLGILMNKGNSTFGQAITPRPINEANIYVPIDVAGTRQPDLFGPKIYGYDDARHITRVPNLGGGNFGQPEFITVDSGPYASGFWIYMAVGDMNGDGTPDLIATDRSDLFIMPNVGHSLGAPIKFPTATSLGVNAIGVADFDGDGRIDIVEIASFQNPTGAFMFIIRNITPGVGPPASIIGITPNRGGNSGTASSIRVTGTGFPADVKAKLVGPGPDIIPTNLSVSPAGNLITLDFNLTGAKAG